MANTLYYLPQKSIVAATGDGLATAAPSAKGIAEIDAADTNLVLAVTDQNGVLVDVAGSAEALTDGTKQTALTLSAIIMFNGASASVVTIKEEDTNGTIIVGPISLAANEERIIVFPETLVTANGIDAIFLQTPTGALAATQGWLIP